MTPEARDRVLSAVIAWDEGNPPRDDNDSLLCVVCGGSYVIEDETYEPTPCCDSCAHQALEVFAFEVAAFRNLLDIVRNGCWQWIANDLVVMKAKYTDETQRIVEANPESHQVRLKR